MIVKIYVNWHEEEVLSEKGYADKVNEKMKEIMEDESELSDFLDDNYSTSQVYRFTAEERVEVDKRFAEHCKDKAEVWLQDDYSEYFIEV